ncbi:MAG: hypothetical protein RIC35_17405 [Marinoscillum sp.]
MEIILGIGLVRVRSIPGPYGRGNGSREKQLNSIEHFGGLEGKEFRSIIEDLLETPNLTYGEVLDINEAVDAII